MSLRVVHLVYSFGIGGLERVIVNLINNSPALDASHSIITLIDDQAFASELEPNVELYCLDKTEGKDLFSHWRLYKMLKKLKPSVVHTYNLGTLEYQVIAWLAGVPIRIHAEHGRETSYKKVTNPIIYELFRKLIIPFLSFYVVVSKDLESWSRTRLGVSDKKLRLIFNGINLSEFKSVKKNLDSNHYTFVCVGRLADVKNHELLINAYKKAIELDAAMKGTKLIIVGDGPNLDCLQAQIENLELDHNVTLVGHCSDVSSILNRSHVFVLSSKYEAMPMTALEAMGCHLPVVAPKVGGVEYILENKVNGLLVEPNSVDKLADALVYAFQNQNDLLRMGECGRARVERDFSVEAMCKRYTELYQANSRV